MKILTATKLSNGLRSTDKCTCREGEWVLLPAVLPMSPGKIAHHLEGFTTLGHTTTMRSVNLPVSEEQYAFELFKANQNQRGAIIADEDFIMVATEAEELLRLAHQFQENQILELADGEIRVRKIIQRE